MVNPEGADDQLTIYLNKQKVHSPRVLRNIYFKFDKHSLDDKYTGDLDQLVSMLQTNESMRVEIAGHTDFKGSEGYNVSLSYKRAESVKCYLVSKGIASIRIVVKGYGEKYPLASNDDEEEGRELNRRTEFVILAE
ncbi:OmpA family protein [Cyclobacteriaceae bacterium]|nr:OmpA family protein [Cyclobacteriaceae bacterium]